MVVVAGGDDVEDNCDDSGDDDGGESEHKDRDSVIHICRACYVRISILSISRLLASP